MSIRSSLITFLSHSIAEAADTMVRERGRDIEKLINDNEAAEVITEAYRQYQAFKAVAAIADGMISSLPDSGLTATAENIEAFVLLAEATENGDHQEAVRLANVCKACSDLWVSAAAERNAVAVSTDPTPLYEDAVKEAEEA